MREELDKALCEKYPKIFRNRHGDMKETCMCWGLCCGDGWYDLIDKMCHLLQFQTDNNGYPQVVAEQVKEKWGELRFYYSIEKSDDDRKVGYVEGIIDFATSMTRMICEDCGSTHQNGIRPLPSWYRSLCDKCTEKRMK
jgi:hypothetical protein